MSQSTQNWKLEMSKAIEHETKIALHAITENFKRLEMSFDADFRKQFLETITER